MHFRTYQDPFDPWTLSLRVSPNRWYVEIELQLFTWVGVWAFQRS